MNERQCSAVLQRLTGLDTELHLPPSARQSKAQLSVLSEGRREGPLSGLCFTA